MEDKKVSLIEIITIVPIVVITDAFDAFALLMFPVPVIGQVVWGIARMVSTVIWLGVQAWMWFRDIRGVYFLAGSFIDTMIPFAQTISLGITIFLVNNPKTSQFARQAATAKRGGLNRARGGVSRAPVARGGAVARGRGVASGRPALAGAVSASTSYIPYGEGQSPEQVGSARLNFASAKRREAEALLTPEAAKDPTERLVKELFYDVGEGGEEGRVS